jgi:MobA/VirD2-like, nuclease domain
MIIKGKSRSGGAALGTYLANAEKNERAEVLEVRGTVASDPRGALIEMEAYGAGTRCERPIYHGIISPEPPYRLSAEQRMEAVDALEKRLGLNGQPRVVVLHEHKGREHLHVAWARVDLDRLKAIPDSHNYRKHEEVARDLERRFGQPRVQGAHAERDGPDGKVKRPERTPSRAEQRQEERTGIKGRDVKAEVTAAFRSSDGPNAFKTALAAKGYVLANGDRRDFVIVDQAGGIHSLARRIDGIRAAALRAFMSPLDRGSLPAAAEAREQQLRHRHDDRKIQPEAEPRSWDNRSAEATTALTERPEQIEQRPAGAEHPTEIAAVAIPSADLSANSPERLAQTEAMAKTQPHDVEIFDRDAAQQEWESRVAEAGIAAAQQQDAERKASYRQLRSADKADQAKLSEMENAAFWKEYAARRDEAALARVEAWQGFAESQRSVGDFSEDHAADAERGALRVLDAATDTVCKLVDFVCDFLIGEPPRQPQHDADRIIAERRAHAALQRIEQQVEQGKALRAEDVRDLTPGQLDHIRQKGDGYVYEIIWRIERERQRADEYGRERER